MAYFEASKLKDNSGNIINPSQEESLTLLRSIFRLLKPLGFITGGGSNRLNLDVNNIVGGTITTVSNIAAGTVTANCNINANQTLGTVSTITNIPTIGGVNTFDLMKAMSRTAYNSGIRSNIN
jgi:hypothetical protein